MALADLHLGATMVLMIHPNFGGKEGTIEQIESKVSYQSARSRSSHWIMSVGVSKSDSRISTQESPNDLS